MNRNDTSTGQITSDSISTKAKAFVWLRILGIIATAAGVIVSLCSFASYYNYKATLSNLVNNDYVAARTALNQMMSDKQYGEPLYTGLDTLNEVLDRIADVDIPNITIEQGVDRLIEEEKQFVADLCRCCDIVYSGKQMTAQEKEWVVAFTEDMREEQKLMKFRREISVYFSANSLK